VGPLFYYELVRLARKGRSTLLRCAYALALLGALYFAYRARFSEHDLLAEPFASPASVPASQLTTLAQEFVLAILWAQTVAVFVLTPVYLAGAVAEEKEQRTLELLFTTHLLDREIVLGKLAARLTHLAGILLAGLPLLAATQLWGGVDVRLLVAAFAMSGLNLLSVGAVSILHSVQARTAREAMARAYLYSAMVFFACLVLPGANPARLFSVLNTLVGNPWSTVSFWLVLACAVGVAGHAILTLMSGRYAVVLLRKVAAFQAIAATVRLPAAREKTDGPADKARRRISPPPVRDHPLLWRETSRSGWSEFALEFEYGFRKDWRLALVLLVGVIAFLGAVGFTVESDVRVGVFGFCMRLAGVGLAVAWCVGTAFRAASSISLERDKGTLDGLLTMPIRREAIPAAKWLGSILRGRELGYALGIVSVLGLVHGVLHPAALPLVAVAVAAQLGFWAGVGLWLSVASRTTLRARVSTALVLLLFAGGLLYLMQQSVVDRFEPEPVAFDTLGFAINPLRVWWFLAFGWKVSGAEDGVDPRLFGAQLAGAVGGALVYASAAGLLWLDACRRFCKA
jgi:ABC-type transport system involved in multi-copper enzyme maturation permease subunit